MSLGRGKTMNRIFTALWVAKPNPVLVQDLVPPDSSPSAYRCFLNSAHGLERREDVVIERVDLDCRRSPSYRRTHLRLSLAPKYLEK